MAADHSTILPFANNLLIGLARKEQYYMEEKILDGQLPLETFQICGLGEKQRTSWTQKNRVVKFQIYITRNFLFWIVKHINFLL